MVRRPTSSRCAAAILLYTSGHDPACCTAMHASRQAKGCLQLATVQVGVQGAAL